ncbi:glycoside hydrolase family 97 protein [Zasmidium cellare ATCC 36951]|uniref:alpha-galactosidase n=1 Tax=Zasmidium cellare ATCC 36951 TaxID=1080233 RepID=A0A6A6C9H3_ZASCE|nr:glycoside hydrolase family 97 protein [Zasmidium cellare ATCC 36951]KAF2162888.1 glycoside hydrolase family 97 protein [Zasmidium cellare ATCC 36951]
MLCWTILYLVFLGTAWCYTKPSGTDRFTSPTGNLEVEVTLQGGHLSYTVFLHGSMIINPSSLGVVRSDGDFSNNLVDYSSEKVPARVEDYTLLQGKRRKVHAVYSSYTCSVVTATQGSFEVQFALSESTVALRYRFPEDESVDSRTILHENTTFAIIKSPGDFQLMQPYDTPTPKYQTFYQPRTDRRRAEIGSTSGAGVSSTGFAFLALFKTQTAHSDAWIVLKEAGFDGTYPASHIANVSSSGVVSLAFPPDDDGNGAFGSGRPQGILPWTTPWRIISIGTDPAAIVSDTSVTDLSEASQIRDTSWIRPGAASWNWWADSSNPLNYTANKEYIDLASQQHWPYTVLDTSWDQQTDSTGHNVSLSTVMADLLVQPRTRRQTMARLAGMGVVGLKVDGIQSDKQEMMAYLLDILQDAAEFRLMVVFHNCPLPHGWERTWPNLLSSEALIASEYLANAKTSYAPQLPENNVNEAFVRLPIGPADYAPGVFSTAHHPGDATLTTYAHEVALNVIIDSGLRTLPDASQTYEHLIPPDITRLLGTLPCVWDETTFVQGNPGKYFVIAKRSGRDLYIGRHQRRDSEHSPVHYQRYRYRCRPQRHHRS